MNFFRILKESRVEDFKEKYGRKFDAQQIQQIVDNVPQKFLDWVGKNLDTIGYQSNFHSLVRTLAKK